MTGPKVSGAPPDSAAGPAVALALGAAACVWAAAGMMFAANTPAFAATALFAVTAAVALSGYSRLRPRPPFGVANGVTLVRAAMIAFVGGFAVAPPAEGASVWWIAAAVAGLAVALDAIDGWIARRAACSSAFGARFDMETDALAALILCLVLWRSDIIGGWILLLGALRYLFVAAGWAFAWMRRPLPPSPWRRAICAAQGVLLVLCLVPAFPAAAPVVLGAAALAMTAASFAVDTLWLYRHRSGPVTAV